MGLADYKNGNTVKKYNFSERHLEYSTSKIFLNNKINLFGFNRKIDTGGNSNIAFSYFTSGFGPVDETSMPFKNNKDLIELGEIQNKKVTAKIIDTVDFPSIYDNSFTEKEEVKEQIKKHIMNHGGVYASIYGAQPYSEYYNNSTGAIFCDKLYADHAVLIIGWDDTYSVNNFNPNHKPQNSGAWIIKNSWGTDIGNNGIMYLSYEDANVYYSLAGIQNATNKIDYDNIYQYNELGYNIVASVYVSGYCGSKIYLANDFSKKTEGKEYLTEIALYAPENYICSVYVNANGTSKHKDFLTKVKLKDGETESFGTGYHTIEFAEPIEIKGNEFTIVVEIENGMNNEVYYCLETNEDEDADDIYKTATIETGKCYISMDGQYEYGVWRDLSDKSFLGFSSDSTIKAFTICEQNEQGNISKEGDVNGDNKVNSLDAVEILKYVAKKKMLTEKQLLLADTTKDDKVNSLDAVRILKFVAKKISKL